MRASASCIGVKCPSLKLGGAFLLHKLEEGSHGDVPELGMHEGGVRVKFIDVAASLPLDGNLACVFEITQDFHHAPFSQTNLAGDFSDCGLRVHCYIEQDQTVTCY